MPPVFSGLEPRNAVAAKLEARRRMDCDCVVLSEVFLLSLCAGSIVGGVGLLLVLGDEAEDLKDIHVVEEGGRRGGVEALVS